MSFSILTHTPEQLMGMDGVERPRSVCSRNSPFIQPCLFPSEPGDIRRRHSLDLPLFPEDAVAWSILEKKVGMAPRCRR